MKDIVQLATASALALMVTTPAFAQANLVGIEDLDERIEDIERDVQDDLERGDDDQRFGPNGVAQGWRGSLALMGSIASGNSDNGDLSLAGRLTYGVGSWSHTFGFAGEYGEANDVKDEESFFAIYEGNYFFNDRLYGFGLARFQYDGFATNERDAFVGFGPGYRIINTADVTWRVQAGPGWRHVDRADGSDDSEAGWVAASRFYYGLTDTMALTMDTDVLGSDINTVATNDLGVNFRMTDSLSTRVSYRTEYNSDPLPGLKHTDNRFGVSLVVGF